ncbi:MAG: YggS family pyridoxal phosphate-dependent enzyme [Polyangiaceae bacterium]|nr:YggS family pyridoxal phosphate-dependent enzyme [Polyangiaceae bacterium]
MSEIAARIAGVRQRIARAASAAGRAPDSVRLLAVSKTKPAGAIREAHAAGQRDFGENYVQELVDKAAALADLEGICWHMLGHLQRNKARQVVKIASAVHTVDSVRLADELGKRAADAGRGPLTALVEVNVGGEAQKSGCAIDALGDVLAAVERAPGLRLTGLMTVPPHTEDPAGARPFFDRLVELRDAHGGATRLPELSMGMTHDLEHAVAAGATWVRVGTAIFGERD